MSEPHKVSAPQQLVFRVQLNGRIVQAYWEYVNYNRVWAAFCKDWMRAGAELIACRVQDGGVVPIKTIEDELDLLDL